MKIISEIISWYTLNKRDLPWRNTKNPYKIWLSEIILQQTRVAQGMEYFHRFVEKFPTIEDLANANEEEVLKLWQGLGYYSRARNLHATAKIIQNQHQGIFPKTHNEIKQLKGIGDYTAAAIASFAYNLPHACVDGNVYRVLSRVFGINTPIDSTEGKKEFFKLANELLPPKNAATYNQAMMEFGAMQCKPKNPDCKQCFIHEHCQAFATNTIDLLPVKAKKTKQRNRYFYYLFLEDEKQNTIINKRMEKDIWQHLYEFPLLEFESNVELEKIMESQTFLEINKNADYTIKNTSKQYKHILSHQVIYATFLHIKTKKIGSNKNNIKINTLQNYAVSRLMHMYMQDVKLIE
ncbi:MAG: A/G-specific adenine glycosylase [Bacteroidota bacterium]